MTPPVPVPPERVVALAAAVEPEFADLARRHPTRVDWTPLPFYASHGLLRASVLLPQHPALFQFLATRASVLDGASAQAVGPAALLPLGAPERLAAANAAAGLRLDAANAVDYLRFALGAVGGAPTVRPRLVHGADRMPWWPRPRPEDATRIAAARERLQGRVAPPRVRPDPAGGLLVAAEALVATTLQSIVWRIAPDGRIERQSAETIEADLPVVVEA